MTKLVTRLRWSCAALAALSLFVALPTARAGTIAYSMTLCEDLGVMLQPNNQILAQNAAMKSQHVLMVERTNPYIELRNTGTENAQITHLTMSIGGGCTELIICAHLYNPGTTHDLALISRVFGIVMVWVSVFFSK